MKTFRIKIEYEATGELKEFIKIITIDSFNMEGACAKLKNILLYDREDRNVRDVHIWEVK